MEYDDLNREIKATMTDLCRLIENFSVIDNEDYNKEYKDSLKNLNNTMEEILE